MPVTTANMDEAAAVPANFAVLPNSTAASIVPGSINAASQQHVPESLTGNTVPIQRNQRISPAHSVNSVGSQGLRRRAELLHEQSEILRQREALLREEYSFLDRNESQYAMPGASTAMRELALNTTQTLQLPPNLVAPLRTSTVQQPESDLSTPIIQSLLDRIQSLEQQLQRNSVSNTERSPQLPAHTTLPTNGHVDSLRFDAPAYRRLTRDQVASRSSLSKELSKYDGKPSEWPLFYAAYTQSTEVCGFSDEENLLRLRQALHSSCVRQIIATLQMRFGRPELIIGVLQPQICDLPSPSESQLESIVDFAVEVQNICATMSASGLTCHLNNPEFEQRLV
uniref:Uncharacterized protein n=1 Tax=Ceratitis capitata TaxID=7213 RepID=W8BY74_CERCA